MLLDPAPLAAAPASLPTTAAHLPVSRLATGTPSGWARLTAVLRAAHQARIPF